MEKIIRNATQNDINILKSLWIECFPKDVEYAEFFFERIFRIECARVCEIEGEIAAMLHSFPYDFSTPDGILHAKYIYGVGTAKRFRSRGLAGELLENEAKDCDFTVIIPQSESLFDFYEKNGFDKLLYTGKAHIRSASGEMIKNAGIGDIAKLNEMYESMCRGSIHPVRSEKRWETIIAEHEFLGGGIAIFDGGYCAYYKTSEGFGISELCPTDAIPSVNSEAEVPTFGSDSRIGAARLITEKAKVAFSKDYERYMNLMHN